MQNEIIIGASYKRVKIQTGSLNLIKYRMQLGRISLHFEKRSNIPTTHLRKCLIQEIKTKFMKFLTSFNSAITVFDISKWVQDV